MKPAKFPKSFSCATARSFRDITLAQSTTQMDWSKIELVVFAKNATTAKGQIFLPGDSALREITLTKTGGRFQLASDPFAGKVAWQIQNAAK